MRAGQSDASAVRLRWRPFEVVAFDLDGTLVELAIDFDAIRQELRCPSGDILDHLDRCPVSERMAAMRVIAAHETRALERARLMPHADEVLATLRQRGAATAIVTRNSARSARAVVDRFGLEVDRIVGRDDAPPKPSPAPLELVMREFGADPSRTAMVGDYLYDLQSARAAGTAAVLYLCCRNEAFIPESDLVIRSLEELLPFVIDIDAAKRGQSP